MDLSFGKRFFCSAVLLGSMTLVAANLADFMQSAFAGTPASAGTSKVSSIPGTADDSAVKWARPDLVQEVLDGKRTEAAASWWGFDAEDSTRFLQAALNSGVKKLTIDRQASEWIVRPLSGAGNLELVLQDG
ncbi:MAG: hypothetical protein J6A23_02280, partial [Thermoguttaceae bacterium]|nr:hypothetical protein [Thermoguttaceae bacterium]